jgi:hypothetical protein
MQASQINQGVQSRHNLSHKQGAAAGWRPLQASGDLGNDGETLSRQSSKKVLHAMNRLCKRQEMAIAVVEQGMKNYKVFMDHMQKQTTSAYSYLYSIFSP